MPLNDFAFQRRVVARGGRQYVCRPPTVETVRRFLLAYPAEVYAMSEMAGRGDVSGLSPENVLPLLVATPRALAHVLGSCVETQGHIIGSDLDVPHEDLTPVALAVCSMSDVERIARSIRPPKPDDRVLDTSTTGPSPHDIAICALAREYGVPPHSIAEWPYESFLSALAVLNTLRAGESESESAISGAELTKIPGIGYGRA